MYTVKKRAFEDHVAANAQDVSVAAVHTTFKRVGSPLDAMRLLVIVDTAIVSTAPVVIKFWQRPTWGSTAAQVLLGQISVPGGTAAGKVLYKDISPTLLLPGQELSFEVTTAATTSGKCVYDLEVSDSPEAAGNLSNMIASA